MSVKYSVRDLAGNEIDTLAFDAVPPGIVNLPGITVFNDGDETPTTTLLGACNQDGTFSGADNAQGQECVTEKWLEAKEGAGEWSPVGGDYANPVNVLSITPPAPGEATEIELRLNIPEGAETGGAFAFAVFAA